MKELILKRCNKCGALIKVINDCNCNNCGIICCDEKMQEIVPNSVDASYEKHIPSYELKEDTDLYSKETGTVYDVNNTVRDTDLKNGSRIILI